MKTSLLYLAVRNHTYDVMEMKPDSEHLLCPQHKSRSLIEKNRTRSNVDKITQNSSHSTSWVRLLVVPRCVVDVDRWESTKPK